MELESQIKAGTMRSLEGGFIQANQVFAGASFKDELADSVGTQLTEILDSGRPR